MCGANTKDTPTYIDITKTYLHTNIITRARTYAHAHSHINTHPRWHWSQRCYVQQIPRTHIHTHINGNIHAHKHTQTNTHRQTHARTHTHAHTNTQVPSLSLSLCLNFSLTHTQNRHSPNGATRAHAVVRRKHTATHCTTLHHTATQYLSHTTNSGTRANATVCGKHQGRNRLEIIKQGHSCNLSCIYIQSEQTSDHQTRPLYVYTCIYK